MHTISFKSAPDLAFTENPQWGHNAQVYLRDQQGAVGETPVATIIPVHCRARGDRYRVVMGGLTHADCGQFGNTFDVIRASHPTWFSTGEPAPKTAAQES